MAFTAANFKMIVGTNSAGGRLWMYYENATLGTIDEDNYFNNAVSHGLLTNDLILISASDGFGFFQCTIDSAKDVVVDANESILSS
jgi:hypothetical protein